MGHSLPTPVLGQKASLGPLCCPRPGTVPDTEAGVLNEWVGRVSVACLGKQAPRGTAGWRGKLSRANTTRQALVLAYPRYWFPGAAVTGYPKLGVLKTTEAYSHSPERKS